MDYVHCGLDGRLDSNVRRWESLRQLRHAERRRGFFTDPLFLALTACVMNRVPADNADVFPLEYVIDYVKVYGFTQ